MMTDQDQAAGRAPVEVSNGLWRHWAEWTGLTAVLALCAGLIPASLMPWWYPVLAGFFAGPVTAAGVLFFSKNGRLASVIAGFGVWLAGWLAVTRLTGVWHLWVLAGWAGPPVVLCLCGAGAMARARAVADAVIEDRAERAMIASAGGEARQMSQLLAEHGAPGATVYTVRQTTFGKSYKGRLERPGEGKKPSTMRDLEGTRETLAVDLQLDLGDVFFETPAGGTSADFVLNVRDAQQAQAETPYLPPKNDPVSITRKMPVGVLLASRKVFEVLFREVHALISGATGSGKSNLLDVLVAQHARCVDNVSFMIDFKGGATAKRWIRPWVQKMCRRPVLDWVATDMAEAYLMLRALLAGMAYRYRTLQGEKIIPANPATGGRPQLTLFIDEAAAGTGNNRKAYDADGNLITSAMLAGMVADLCEGGRAAAIAVIICSVRADAGAIGNSRVKAACKVRYGLSVTQATEAGAVFPDHQKAAQILVGIVQRGAGLVLNLVKGEKISPPVHFYRLTDGTVDEETMEPAEDRITPIAADCGDNITCPLDEGTAEAMGMDYATRWTRPHGMELKAQCGAVVTEQSSTGDPEFDAIVSQIPDPDADLDPREQTLRRLLREAGPAGMTPDQSLNALLDLGEGAARETVQRWLSKMLAAGLVKKNAKVPTKPRYIWENPAA